MHQRGEIAVVFQVAKDLQDRVEHPVEPGAGERQTLEIRPQIAVLAVLVPLVRGHDVLPHDGGQEAGGEHRCRGAHRGGQRPGWAASPARAPLTWPAPAAIASPRARVKLWISRSPGVEDVLLQAVVEGHQLVGQAQDRLAGQHRSVDLVRVLDRSVCETPDRQRVSVAKPVGRQADPGSAACPADPP